MSFSVVAFLCAYSDPLLIRIGVLWILDERGEKLLEKPQGTYITIEAEGIIEEEDGVKETGTRIANS